MKSRVFLQIGSWVIDLENSSQDFTQLLKKHSFLKNFVVNKPSGKFIKFWVSLIFLSKMPTSLYRPCLKSPLYFRGIPDWGLVFFKEIKKNLFFKKMSIKNIFCYLRGQLFSLTDLKGKKIYFFCWAPKQKYMDEFSSHLESIFLHCLYGQKNQLLHAACAVKDKKAALFIGGHGSGKSTVAKHLAKKFKILADEAVIIEFIGKDIYAYAIPWGWQRKIFLKQKGLFKKYPLEKIYILKRFGRNLIQPVSKSRCLVGIYKSKTPFLEDLWNSSLKKNVSHASIRRFQFLVKLLSTCQCYIINSRKFSLKF